MKKYLIALAFSIAYALVLSLGIECMLNATSLLMFGAQQYPRFFRFSLVVGLLALVALVVLVIVDLKVAEKVGFTKTVWKIQWIIAAVASIPLIKPWELLIHYLRGIF